MSATEVEGSGPGLLYYSSLARLAKWRSTLLLFVTPVTYFRFIVLEPGKPSNHMEVVSMYRSRISITEINLHVLLLYCFGESGLFDEIAVSIAAAE